MDDKLIKIIFSKTALTLFSPFLPKYRHWTLLYTRLRFLLIELFDGKWSLLCDEYIITTGDMWWAITNPLTINGSSRQIPDQSRLWYFPHISTLAHPGQLSDANPCFDKHKIWPAASCKYYSSIQILESKSCCKFQVKDELTILTSSVSVCVF